MKLMILEMNKVLLFSCYFFPITLGEMRTNRRGLITGNSTNVCCDVFITTVCEFVCVNVVVLSFQHFLSLPRSLSCTISKRHAILWSADSDPLSITKTKWENFSVQWESTNETYRIINHIKGSSTTHLTPRMRHK